MADLFSQYQTRLDPITKRSEDLLRDYYAFEAQRPTFEQQLLDAIKQAGQYPSHAAMRQEYMQNPNLTPMAIEALVSRRGQAGRGTIQDIMGRATGGFESDIMQRRAMADISERQRANLLEEYGLAKAAQPGKGTAADRQKAILQQAITKDVENYMTPVDLRAKYGGQIEDWELINLYNQYSPYGPMKEKPGEFAKMGEESIEDIIRSLQGDKAGGLNLDAGVSPTAGASGAIKSWDEWWEGL